MKRSGLLLIGVDWLAGIVAWFSFFVYRKQIETPELDISAAFADPKLLIGVLIVPIAWLILWYFLGMYEGVFRKSRIQTIYQTFAGVILGALVLLFTAIRDDLTLEVTSYLTSFTIVLTIHFILFSVFRIVFLTATKYMLRKGYVMHRGLMVYDESEVTVAPPLFTKIVAITRLADWSNESIVKDIDSVVIAEENKENLNRQIAKIVGTANDKAVFISETCFSMLEYDYDATPNLGDSYITMKTIPIAQWQQNLKRILDIFLSGVALLILFPLFVWLYIRVHGSSEGPVIFIQERIGKNGKVFSIFKFRTMYKNAEKEGPALASKNDERCTHIGRWMRRWRFDELPQFYNVLKGDMSLVGPRPERPFYAEQLIASNSRYPLLWQVRPGITSWGQIKYGYASSIEEMLRRFRYDLLYLENMSILLDIRILYYTLLVLMQGRGR